MTTKKLSASSIRQHWSSFSHLEAARAFCVRGVQNSGSGAKQTEEKQKTKTNKQNKKQTGNQAISYFTIVLSSYDADLSFDQTTHQRLFFLQVMVADNTNSRSNNTIGEITHEKMIMSLSECIILLLLLSQCVAIVTVNLLSIILFIKNKSHCTRNMYLVMSLTVVNLLVGSLWLGVLIVFLAKTVFVPM